MLKVSGSLSDCIDQAKRELSKGSLYERLSYPLDANVAYLDYVEGAVSRRLMREEMKESGLLDSESFQLQLADRYLSEEGGKDLFIRDCKKIESDESTKKMNMPLTSFSSSGSSPSPYSKASTSGDNSSSKDKNDNNDNNDKNGLTLNEDGEEIWEAHVVERFEKMYKSYVSSTPLRLEIIRMMRSNAIWSDVEYHYQMIVEQRYLELGGRARFVRDCYLGESERVQRSTAVQNLQEQQYASRHGHLHGIRKGTGILMPTKQNYTINDRNDSGNGNTSSDAILTSSDCHNDHNFTDTHTLTDTHDTHGRSSSNVSANSLNFNSIVKERRPSKPFQRDKAARTSVSVHGKNGNNGSNGSNRSNGNIGNDSNRELSNSITGTGRQNRDFSSFSLSAPIQPIHTHMNNHATNATSASIQVQVQADLQSNMATLVNSERFRSLVAHSHPSSSNNNYISPNNNNNNNNRGGILPNPNAADGGNVGNHQNLQGQGQGQGESMYSHSYPYPAATGAGPCPSPVPELAESKDKYDNDGGIGIGIGIGIGTRMGMGIEMEQICTDSKGENEAEAEKDEKDKIKNPKTIGYAHGTVEHPVIAYDALPIGGLNLAVVEGRTTQLKSKSRNQVNNNQGQQRQRRGQGQANSDLQFTKDVQGITSIRDIRDNSNNSSSTEETMSDLTEPSVDDERIQAKGSYSVSPSSIPHSRNSRTSRKEVITRERDTSQGVGGSHNHVHRDHRNHRDKDQLRRHRENRERDKVSTDRGTTTVLTTSALRALDAKQGYLACNSGHRTHDQLVKGGISSLAHTKAMHQQHQRHQQLEVDSGYSRSNNHNGSSGGPNSNSNINGNSNSNSNMQQVNVRSSSVLEQESLLAAHASAAATFLSTIGNQTHNQHQHEHRLRSSGSLEARDVMARDTCSSASAAGKEKNKDSDSDSVNQGKKASTTTTTTGSKQRLQRLQRERDGQKKREKLEEKRRNDLANIGSAADPKYGPPLRRGRPTRVRKEKKNSGKSISLPLNSNSNSRDSNSRNTDADVDAVGEKRARETRAEGDAQKRKGAGYPARSKKQKQ